MTVTREARMDRRGKLTKTLLTGFFASLMLATAAMPATAATPPTFPNNIVIFPERDFVALEGYESKAGQQATVTVLRGGEVSGQSVGTVGAGDPSLEINHPGGVCWNQEIAPGIRVTPNIKPGDTVRVQFRDGTTVTGSDSARTQAARVTGFSTPGTNQLVVNGRIGANVNPNFVEQRVINPDLGPTAVGRRDIRAPERAGPYTSSLTFSPGTGARSFTATYTFRNAANEDGVQFTATEMRDIAAEGQMRVLAWMDQTPGGDRQGITIYEFGELGGPGFGGCPAGPENTAPLAPGDVTARARDAAARAIWTDASVIPDGSPITGYRVTATDTANSVSTSARFAADANAGTVQNLINGREYRITVRATSDAGAGKSTRAANTVTPQAAPAPPPASPAL